MQVSTGMRLCVMVAVALLVSTMWVAPGGATGEERSRDVGYSASSTDRNAWSAQVQGEVRFYSGYRQFTIFGGVQVRRGSFSSTNVYVAVKQNIANTLNDGRWYSIGYATCCDSDSDRELDYDTTADGVTYLFIGDNDSGEYFEWPTSAGRPLKGVWVRTCHYVDGPDVCGRRTYVDNPYVAGTTA